MSDKSPSGGQPTGPADLREAAYLARQAEKAEAEAADKLKRAAKRAAAKVTREAGKSKADKLFDETVKAPRKTPRIKNAADLVAVFPPVEPKAKTPRAPRAKAADVPAFVPDTLVARYSPALVPAGPSREAWLQAAVEHLRIDFTEAGFPVPEQVRVSVGWPGGRGKKSGVIGQCWPQSMASDSLHAIFISPVLTDPLKVLGVLVHEVVHASVDKGSKHSGAFVKAARHIGLTAPWTATGESPELVERLTIIAGILGDYNHGGLTQTGRQSVQSTRMLKVTCSDCGCVLRMTQKWITDAGLPSCGCGAGEMEQSA